MSYLDLLKQRILDEVARGAATKATEAPFVPFVAPLPAPPRQISSCDSQIDKITQTTAPAPLTLAEESAIRRWLAHIQETDPDLIDHVMEACRANADKRRYYLARSAEAPVTVAPVEHVAPSCMTCIHRRGRHDLHGGCVARTDLRPMYGPNHPLRELPDDGGANCASFAPRADLITGRQTRH